MKRPRPYPRLLAAVVLVAGLGVLAPGTATAGTSLADRIAAIRAGGGNWRTALAADLAALPELRTAQAVSKPMSGQVLAGTLRLPATVELAGDTTIIARELVLTNGSLRVDGKGKKFVLTLYPVSKIRTDGGYSTQRELVMDASGNDGFNGSPGSVGRYGWPGWSGYSGQPGDEYTCDGEDGTPGGDGGNAEGGGDGTNGADGGASSGINLDIPDGSTDSYRLIAHGGSGGSGGSGGQGGSGGDGGPGGNGGAGNYNCYWGTPGMGGWGGNGGNGGSNGKGGNGGNGGRGGDGGTVTVSYPPGYDPGWISADVAAGGAGSGGSGGFRGFPGHGGSGGSGGPPDYSHPGQPGNDGDGLCFGGSNPGHGDCMGNNGNDGAFGNGGVVNLNPR